MTSQTDQCAVSIQCVFDRLEQWRHLPAYQLERRVDIFLSFCLPEVVKSKFQLKQDEELFVVPEFPLHKGEVFNAVKNKNQSVKVDFAVFAKNEKRIFLLEFKTDNNSISSAQLKCMGKANNANTLLNGVKECALHSDSPRKYAHLLWTLQEIGCIKNCDNLKEVELNEKGAHLKDKFRSIEVCEHWVDAVIQFGLIYPSDNAQTDATQKELKKVRKLTWLKLISFSEVLKILRDHPLETFLKELTKFEAGRKSLCKKEH